MYKFTLFSQNLQHAKKTKKTDIRYNLCFLLQTIPVRGGLLHFPVRVCGLRYSICQLQERHSQGDHPWGSRPIWPVCSTVSVVYRNSIVCQQYHNAVFANNVFVCRLCNMYNSYTCTVKVSYFFVWWEDC
jgi:hypothetical protein